jgi:hypothetical protein
MKTNKFTFYISLTLLAVINTFCIWVEHAQVVKNLNASSATAYYNIESNSVSAADKSWTISFNRTAIEINTGTGIQVVDKSYDQVIEVPQTGYLKALPKGSGNSWYEYDMFSHSITPLPQKTLVLQLTSGKYVKIEIQSYYKDGNGESAYYTFRYDYIK